MLVPPDGREAAAARLRSAVTSHRSCAPVRDLLGTTDIEAAYAVASANIAERITAGRRRIGRKIGLTSPAVQRQLGVDQPDFGVLFDDMAVPAGDAVPSTAACSSRRSRPRSPSSSARDLDDDAASTTCQRAVDVRAGRARDRGQPDRRLGHHHRRHRRRQRLQRRCSCSAPNAVPLDGARPARRRGWRWSATARRSPTGTGAACLGDPLNAAGLAGRAPPATRRPAARRGGRALRRARPDGARRARATAFERSDLTGLGSVDGQLHRITEGRQ